MATTRTGPEKSQGHPPLVAPSSTSGLLEVFRQRYLLGMLVRNAIKSRYQGTVLGWLWSYLQPATRFAMFYFVFQIMIGRGGEEVENFAIHLFAGMVVVHFFSETFNGGTQSLVQNRSLITKLSMPKELFPVARMLVAGWHTGPMLVILIVACLLSGWRPEGLGLAAAALSIALVAVLGLALALLFSVANVFFRDFGKVVQTLNQFVTFSVPMMYSYTMVEERFGGVSLFGVNGADLYLLNPVAEAVLLMQRGFWVGTTDDPESTITSHLPSQLWERGLIMLAVSVVLLVLAQVWFSRLEGRVPERL